MQKVRLCDQTSCLIE